MGFTQQLIRLSRRRTRYARAMPSSGSITVGDIARRLEYLNLVCDKCGRRGRA